MKIKINKQGKIVAWVALFILYILSFVYSSNFLLNEIDNNGGVKSLVSRIWNGS